MSTPPAHTVVVGVDGTTAGREALSYGVREAQQRRVALALLRAWDPPELNDGVPLATLQEVEESGAAALQLAAQAVEELAPGLQHTEHLVRGRPETVLVDAGEHAALLVVGRHDGSAAWLGSVIGHVATRCVCPVAVVPADGSARTGPVVVGVDGSGVSARAVAHAFDCAARSGRSLTAVLAVRPDAETHRPGHELPDVIRERARRKLAEALAGYGERFPEVRVERVFALEAPFPLLLRAAQDASLLVVGSHGRGAVLRWALGSVSSSLLRASPCPVVVVHPDQARAPRPRAAAPVEASTAPRSGRL